jgi:hypothetical protein
MTFQEIYRKDVESKLSDMDLAILSAFLADRTGSVHEALFAVSGSWNSILASVNNLVVHDIIVIQSTAEGVFYRFKA